MLNKKCESSLKGKGLKQKLSRKEPVRVVGLWFAYPLVAEMMSHMDIDAMFIDMEHAPWDIATITATLSATAASGVAVIARPRTLDDHQAQLLLDLGVDGIAVAHCDDLATAHKAVASTRYPPLGQRGIGPTRTGAYLNDMYGYLKQANDATALWLQVESRVPKDELIEMLTLRGVDGLLLGPADLATSMGHIDQWDHPDVIDTIAQTVDIARQLDVPFGVPGMKHDQWDDQLIHLFASDIGALQLGMEQATANWNGREGNHRKSVSHTTESQ